MNSSAFCASSLALDGLYTTLSKGLPGNFSAYVSGKKDEHNPLRKYKTGGDVDGNIQYEMTTHPALLSAVLTGSLALQPEDFCALLSDILLTRLPFLDDHANTSGKAHTSDSERCNEIGHERKAADEEDNEDHKNSDVRAKIGRVQDAIFLCVFIPRFFLELRRCRRIRTLDLLSKTLTLPLLAWIESHAAVAIMLTRFGEREVQALSAKLSARTRTSTRRRTRRRTRASMNGDQNQMRQPPPLPVPPLCKNDNELFYCTGKDEENGTCEHAKERNEEKGKGTGNWEGMKENETNEISDSADVIEYDDYCCLFWSLCCPRLVALSHLILGYQHSPDLAVQIAPALARCYPLLVLLDRACEKKKRRVLKIIRGLCHCSEHNAKKNDSGVHDKDKDIILFNSANDNGSYNDKKDKDIFESESGSVDIISDGYIQIGGKRFVSTLAVARKLMATYNETRCCLALLFEAGAIMGLNPAERKEANLFQGKNGRNWRREEFWRLSVAAGSDNKSNRNGNSAMETDANTSESSDEDKSKGEFGNEQDSSAAVVASAQIGSEHLCASNVDTEWPCSLCTFLNNETAVKCEMCNQLRSPGIKEMDIKEGDYDDDYSDMPDLLPITELEPGVKEESEKEEVKKKKKGKEMKTKVGRESLTLALALPLSSVLLRVTRAMQLQHALFGRAIYLGMRRTELQIQSEIRRERERARERTGGKEQERGLHQTHKEVTDTNGLNAESSSLYIPPPQSLIGMMMMMESKNAAKDEVGDESFPVSISPEDYFDGEKKTFLRVLKTDTKTMATKETGTETKIKTRKKKIKTVKSKTKTKKTGNKNHATLRFPLLTRAQWRPLIHSSSGRKRETRRKKVKGSLPQLCFNALDQFHWLQIFGNSNGYMNNTDDNNLTSLRSFDADEVISLGTPPPSLPWPEGAWVCESKIDGEGEGKWPWDMGICSSSSGRICNTRSRRNSNGIGNNSDSPLYIRIAGKVVGVPVIATLTSPLPPLRKPPKLDDLAAALQLLNTSEEENETSGEGSLRSQKEMRQQQKERQRKVAAEVAKATTQAAARSPQGERRVVLRGFLHRPIREKGDYLGCTTVGEGDFVPFRLGPMTFLGEWMRPVARDDSKKASRCKGGSRTYHRSPCQFTVFGDIITGQTAGLPPCGGVRPLVGSRVLHASQFDYKYTVDSVEVQGKGSGAALIELPLLSRRFCGFSCVDTLSQFPRCLSILDSYDPTEDNEDRDEHEVKKSEDSTHQSFSIDATIEIDESDSDSDDGSGNSEITITSVVAGCLQFGMGLTQCSRLVGWACFSVYEKNVKFDTIIDTDQEKEKEKESKTVAEEESIYNILPKRDEEEKEKERENEKKKGRKGCAGGKLRKRTEYVCVVTSASLSLAHAHHVRLDIATGKGRGKEVYLFIDGVPAQCGCYLRCNNLPMRFRGFGIENYENRCLTEEGDTDSFLIGAARMRSKKVVINDDEGGGGELRRKKTTVRLDYAVSSADISLV